MTRLIVRPSQAFAAKIAPQRREKDGWKNKDNGKQHKASVWLDHEQRRPNYQRGESQLIAALSDFENEAVGLLDSNLYAAVDGVESSIQIRVGVAKDHQHKGIATNLIDAAVQSLGANRIAAFINKTHEDTPPTIAMLKKYKCNQSKWARLIKMYPAGYMSGYDGLSPHGITAVQELFAWDTIRIDRTLTRVYLDYSHNLSMRVATVNDLDPLTWMRMAISDRLQYDTNIDRVQEVTRKLLDQDLYPLTKIFIIENVESGLPIGTIRASAHYNVEYGMTEVELRDLYLDAKYRGFCLPRKIFPASVLFSSELIAPELPLIVSTLCSSDHLATHLLGMLEPGWGRSDTIVWESK